MSQLLKGLQAEPDNLIFLSLGTTREKESTDSLELPSVSEHTHSHVHKHTDNSHTHTHRRKPVHMQRE